MRRLTRPLVPMLGPALTLAMILVLTNAPQSPASPVCRRGFQFWDTSQQTCSNCTQCSQGLVVLRPCQPHADTFCGPLSALMIDWSFARPQNINNKKPVTARVTTKPRSIKVVQPKVQQVTLTSSTSTSTTVTAAEVTTTQQTVPVPDTSTESKPVQVEVTSTPLTTVSTSTSSTPHTSPQRPLVSAQPFSASESLVWDWQALTMIIAITACALFMVVLAGYAVVQARSATGRRRQLERDLEEATAHLSLFTSSEQPALLAEGLIPIAAAVVASSQHRQSSHDTETAGLYSTNQCLYLEKLLERKQRQGLQRGTRGNIYVETGRQATPAPARRSTRWKPSSSRSQGGLR